MEEKEVKMRQVFKKTEFRACLGNLTCEVIGQLDKIGLIVGDKTLRDIVKYGDTKFEVNNGEGGNVAIKTRYHYSQSNNCMVKNGSVSLVWNTMSGHKVEISESWAGIPVMEGFVVVKIGDDESEQFYPGVIKLLGEIPLLDERRRKKDVEETIENFLQLLEEMQKDKDERKHNCCVFGNTLANVRDVAELNGIDPESLQVRENWRSYFSSPTQSKNFRPIGMNKDGSYNCGLCGVVHKDSKECPMNKK